MDVREYIKSYAVNYAKSSKASSLKIIEERPLPTYEPFDEEMAKRLYAERIELEQRRQNASLPFNWIYAQGMCIVFELIVGNIEYRFAVATIVEAARYQMSGGFLNRMADNSAIDWQSDGVFTLQAFPDKFEAAYRGAFTDFCSTFRISNEVRRRFYDMQTNIQADIARTTRQQIDSMNMQFRTWQQINASQQAAFDSANRAWWDRTNASDSARRERYQSSHSSGVGDFAEAMRGVNTYVRDDGSEVEVSVDYDRAYTNNMGDVLGSNSAFEPGGSWTEMKRK